MRRVGDIVRLRSPACTSLGSTYVRPTELAHVPFERLPYRIRCAFHSIFVLRDHMSIVVRVGNARKCCLDEAFYNIENDNVCIVLLETGAMHWLFAHELIDIT